MINDFSIEDTVEFDDDFDDSDDDYDEDETDDFDFILQFEYRQRFKVANNRCIRSITGLFR